MGHGRRWLVGVMGGGDGATPEAIALPCELGGEISRRGWALLSGGRPRGVMAAVAACCELIGALERGERC